MKYLDQNRDHFSDADVWVLRRLYDMIEHSCQIFQVRWKGHGGELHQYVEDDSEGTWKIDEECCG